MPTPVPGPKGVPVLGNLLDVQSDIPIEAFERLADVYKDCFKLKLGGHDQYFVCGAELFDELCDETRFFKFPPPALVANVPEDKARGLFGARTEKDDDWAQAHRILMPAFGPMAIENMYDEMYDIATQLIMKWARQDSNTKVHITDDFTRLTLDTIALCAMDYRFNSFYTEDMHPYVKAMTLTLTAQSERGQIGNIFKRLMPSYKDELKKSDEYMLSVSEELVAHRRQNPTDKKDLLNAMVHGRDPKTGKQMRDALIAANMQTFLIAGHETTSGLLSFAFMEMLLNPMTFFAAQQEVDRVIGEEKVQAKHLKELKYLEALLRETLRLHPTAPGFARGVRPENKEETVLVGKAQYEIPRNKAVLCLLTKIQKDPHLYGEDAHEFRPERMLDENFNKLPKNAWRPFGTGLRSCIGRAFAWQEALLVAAMVLQNFDMSLDDPNYQIRIVHSLTIKPKDGYVKVKLRPGLTAASLQNRLSGTKPSAQANLKNGETSGHPAHANGDGNLQPLTIIYGSNTGTCQALAQRLAGDAADQGFHAEVKDMDDGVGFSDERDAGPLVVITASYEGQPPDNANRFVAWLQSLESTDRLKESKFAVFGCGHKDWRSTYQRIPTLVDDKLAANGASRIVERGASDASERDVSGDFDTWANEKLWPALASQLNRKAANTKPKMPSVEFEISQEKRAEQLQQKSQWTTVASAERLTGDEVPEKRHIEFKLPEDMHYKAGDYLAVLPLNPDDTLRRVTQRFNLPKDGVITITKSASTTLPSGKPISVADLLRGYVELAQPASRKDLELLLDTVPNGEEQEKLQHLMKEPTFTDQVLERRASILDILESVVPSSTIKFASFLALLPPLKARHYSISSSPLADPSKCSLTYSVIDAPTWADQSKRFIGVAGGYLKTLQKGDQALVSVRSSNTHFRPPVAPDTTPMIMLCAGSGLAPFRGFVQERAVMIRDGRRKLAPALLFVGCRSSSNDRLYAEEIDEWARQGIVDVRYAFSQEPDHELAQGCKRIQDRLLKDRRDLVTLFQQGAKVYTCGSGQLLKDLRDAAKQIIWELKMNQGASLTEEDIEAWFAKNHNDRFVSDVFS